MVCYYPGVLGAITDMWIACACGLSEFRVQG